MDTSSIFKFATLRSVQPSAPTPAQLLIQPNSPLVVDLTSINEGKQTKAQKLAAFNKKLQSFIKSDKFFKSKKDLDAALSQTGKDLFYNQLYDNIVARSFTKSNTTQIYKQVIEQLKTEHLLRNTKTVPGVSRQKLKILLPDGLILNFIESIPLATTPPVEPIDGIALAARYQQFTELKDLVQQAKEENVIQFEPNGRVLKSNPAHMDVTDALGVQSITASDAQAKVNLELTRLQGLDQTDQNVQAQTNRFRGIQASVTSAQAQNTASFSRTLSEDAKQFDAVTKTLAKASLTVHEADLLICRQLTTMTADLLRAAPKVTYALIGDRWIDTSGLSATLSTGSTPGRPSSPFALNKDSILVYSHGCWLKFPFQIADLRVVEQQTVGYLPGEIAHINNTQPGGLNTRVTRRLKRTEDFESLFTENEVMHESDSQSTEKFGMEKAASQVQTEEDSWNVNASLSASYGPVKASVDGGYESTTSTTDSNSASQTYAKEVVQKVVDRVSQKVRRERSTKTVEEFEETVTQVMDNSKSDEPKSYVYRWLNKLSRVTLKNYGKRLMFQIDIAHPSHYHLSRSIKTGSTVTLPDAPSKVTIGTKNYLITGPTDINKYNYLPLANYYNAKVDIFKEFQTVTKGYAGDAKSPSHTTIVEDLIIPAGYEVTKAYLSGGISSLEYFVTYVTPVGRLDLKFDSKKLETYDFVEGMKTNSLTRLPADKLTITIFGFYDQGYHANLSLDCRLSEEGELAWQIKTYQAIMEGYEKLKQEAEEKMSEFNPNLPGLNPDQKTQIIKTELKKEALRKMFRCNPFSASDQYVVGQEYNSDCCVDSENAEKARFLETTFDWRNMTYEFYPYFYGDRIAHNESKSDNWDAIQKITDSDPHFESFLQASYATVCVPVNRDAAKEIAAVNFILNNSIANHEILPESMQSLLSDLQDEVVTKFTYDINGNELPAPKETIDLGIYPTPTSLVILEYGTQNGVNPRPFPESQDPPTSDVLIPKQYSPAIISEPTVPHETP